MAVPMTAADAPAAANGHGLGSLAAGSHTAASRDGSLPRGSQQDHDQQQQKQQPGAAPAPAQSAHTSSMAVSEGGRRGVKRRAVDIKSTARAVEATEEQDAARKTAQGPGRSAQGSAGAGWVGGAAREAPLGAEADTRAAAGAAAQDGSLTAERAGGRLQHAAGPHLELPAAQPVTVAGSAAVVAPGVSTADNCDLAAGGADGGGADQAPDQAPDQAHDPSQAVAQQPPQEPQQEHPALWREQQAERQAGEHVGRERGGGGQGDTGACTEGGSHGPSLGATGVEFGEDQRTAEAQACLAVAREAVRLLGAASNTAASGVPQPLPQPKSQVQSQPQSQLQPAWEWERELEPELHLDPEMPPEDAGQDQGQGHGLGQCQEEGAVLEVAQAEQEQAHMPPQQQQQSGLAAKTCNGALAAWPPLDAAEAQQGPAPPSLPSSSESAAGAPQPGGDRVQQGAPAPDAQAATLRGAPASGNASAAACVHAEGVVADMSLGPAPPQTSSRHPAATDPGEQLTAAAVMTASGAAAGGVGQVRPAAGSHGAGAAAARQRPHSLSPPPPEQQQQPQQQAAQDADTASVRPVQPGCPAAREGHEVLADDGNGAGGAAVSGLVRGVERTDWGWSVLTGHGLQEQEEPQQGAEEQRHHLAQAHVGADASGSPNEQPQGQQQGQEQFQQHSQQDRKRRRSRWEPQQPSQGPLEQHHQCQQPLRLPTARAHSDSKGAAPAVTPYLTAAATRLHAPTPASAPAALHAPNLAAAQAACTTGSGSGAIQAVAAQALAQLSSRAMAVALGSSAAPGNTAQPGNTAVSPSLQVSVVTGMRGLEAGAGSPGSVGVPYRRPGQRGGVRHKRYQ